MGILLEQVSFSYGEKRTLEQIDLKIEAGEQVGIMGSSGSGKSTLVKLIAGLYKPTLGKIEVAGATVMEQIRKEVAVVMQNPMLLPGTIRENITCGHEMSEDWLKHVCQEAQLSEWIETLPDGIDQDLGERGNKLSGGQAQRIAIARAFAKNASVIILDEATSALDQETKSAVMAALSRLTKGKTVLHVTHQPELLTECDHIYSMIGGRLYEK